MPESKPRNIDNDFYPDRPAPSKSFISFDSTINAGHIMTAITILLCSIGAWYDMKSEVKIVKEDQVKQQIQIEKIFADQVQYQKDIHDDFEKMRDDNKQWFMRLDDKLDRKMDKKGS